MDTPIRVNYQPKPLFNKKQQTNQPTNQPNQTKPHQTTKQLKNLES